MKKIILLFIISFSVQTSLSQTKADDILGQYWTDTKEGKIEIYKKGNKYFGKIIWRKDARKDTKNPNKNLRNRSVVGIDFMTDFVFSRNKWTDGEVYSIENGGTYSGKMWLEDKGKTLKMRGYVGISLFGKTATLTRVKENL